MRENRQTDAYVNVKKQKDEGKTEALTWWISSRFVCDQHFRNALEPGLLCFAADYKWSVFGLTNKGRIFWWHICRILQIFLIAENVAKYEIILKYEIQIYLKFQQPQYFQIVKFCVFFGYNRCK